MTLRTRPTAATTKPAPVRAKFYQGPAGLDHYVRASGPSGGAPLDDFVDMLRKISGSTTRMQKEWLGTTRNGVLWSIAKGHNDFGDGTGFNVSLDLKPNRRGYFDPYDAGNVTAWKDWQSKANLKRPNFFTRSQVEELKREGWPTHSAFFEDNGLAGIVWRYEDGAGTGKPAWAVDDWAHVAYCLVDARAVKKMTVTRDLPYSRADAADLRSQYGAKDANYIGIKQHAYSLR
jgi:hypothetical protein